LGVSLFFAIPCIIMLVTTTMSKLCCKVAPIYMTMTFTYFFQIFFCFAAGMTLFFAILWNDVCVVHDDVIKVTIGNYTTKIRDTEVQLYDTIMDLLKCGHVSAFSRYCYVRARLIAWHHEATLRILSYRIGTQTSTRTWRLSLASSRSSTCLNT